MHLQCKVKVQEVAAYVEGIRTGTEGYPKKGEVDLVAGGPPCQVTS